MENISVEISVTKRDAQHQCEFKKLAVNSLVNEKEATSVKRGAGKRRGAPAPETRAVEN